MRHDYSARCAEHRSEHFKGNQLPGWIPPKNILAYGDLKE
jgi:hypothetical protein